MTNSSPEQLMKWKEAGVLFEVSRQGAHWFGPYSLYHIDTEHGRFRCKNEWFDFIRPYRAPGHIQPHDGSADRPEHVAEDALVLFHIKGLRWGVSPCNWLRALAAKSDYYIVLSEIQP